MSILKAYIKPVLNEEINKEINKETITIEEYEEKKHKDKIYCSFGHELIAKKGTHKIHHFCHKNKNECGEIYNKMGEWHNSMQNRIMKKYIEIPIKKKDHNNKLKLHIADVKTDENIIIEYQKSIISENIILERDYFYNKYFKKLIWVFYISRNDLNIIEQYGDLICFKFNKGSQYFLSSTSKSYLDQNKNGLIEVLYKHKTKNTYSYIFGKYVSFKDFDTLYLKNCLNKNCDNRIDRPQYDIKFKTNILQQTQFIKKYIHNYTIV